MAKGSGFKINYNLLPVKAHYFLLNGGLAGVLQYLPVYAKSLGISAIPVGIIYTILPFISLVAKPFFGGLADRLQKLKAMIMIFVLIVGVFYLALLLIPTIKTNDLQNKFNIHSKLQCINNQNMVSLPSFNSSCLYDLLSKNKMQCDVICYHCAYGSEENQTITSMEQNVTYCEKYEYLYNVLLKFNSENLTLQAKYNSSFWTLFIHNADVKFGNTSVFCESEFQTNATIDQKSPTGKYKTITRNSTHCKNSVYNLFYYSSVKEKNISLWTLKISEAIGTEIEEACLSRNTKCSISCEPSVYNCFQNAITEDDKYIYTTYQFWLFLIFIIFAWVSTGISTSLSDAMCFEILKGEMHLYGKQRLWGTVGWGAFAALSGYLNSVATQLSSHENYLPGFFILGGLLTFDLVVVSRTNVRTCERSKNIAKDVGLLFLKPHILLFTFSVFVIGVFIGLMWSYLFWYIGELGGSQTLMGLASAVQCFLGELPFFFFSGWIIKKFGHFNTLGIAIFASGIRYISYSYLYNPWLVLLIEILQGPAFGAFYPAMTSYAKATAPQGTEATMQGILGGAFEGLGIAVGSLFGGLGFGTYGGRTTFFYAGIIAFSYGALHFVLHFILLKMKKKQDEEPEEEEPSENTPFS